MKKAVCLISGGLDSAVAAAQANNDGFSIIALTFDYGQRHSREIMSARKIAHALGAIEHIILKVPLSIFGGSALTDPKIQVPKGGAGIAVRGKTEEIPTTYVPCRNIIFLTIACSLAEARGAEAIYIGANYLDYSGYPDCRPQFFRAFSKMLAIGTRDGKKIKVKTPIIKMTKAQIIRQGVRLGVPLRHTVSCYEGQSSPCGRCDSCIIRARGFKEAGLPDPAQEKTIKKKKEQGRRYKS